MSDHFQDILGQLPILKSYTHILLCFALANENQEAVVEGLQGAVHALLQAFPFLGGRVVHRDVHPGCSGRFMVEKWSSIEDDAETGHYSVLRIKHHPQLAYESLRSAQCPPTLIPSALLSPPRPAFPERYSDDSLPAPVLDIQANFITGGLLIDFVAQHNIIDAAGMFYIIHVLSLVMKSATSSSGLDPGSAQTRLIPETDVHEGNRDRRTLIPLLNPHEEVPAPLISALKPSARPPPLHPDVLAEHRWQWVHFPPRTVAALHADANSQPQDFPEESMSFVSVNDALTAFCWQGATRVRFPSSPDKPRCEEAEESDQRQTHISRAIDLRRSMSLTKSYMGHMVRTANMHLPISTVLNASLSYLSSRLRKCAFEHATPQAVREYATLIARENDKTKIAYGGRFDPRTDFSCSSVAHVKLQDFDFGEGLGTPEFMRRPAFGPLPGGMYIGPGRLGEGLDGVVCLRGEELERLREIWRGMVEFIG